jgi:hypothetical protein
MPMRAGMLVGSRARASIEAPRLPVGFDGFTEDRAGRVGYSHKLALPRAAFSQGVPAQSSQGDGQSW